jgi:CBS domain-containing protein
MTAIRALMNQNVVTSTPDETVAAVARRMRDASIGAVLIVEDGALRGVFTERDALNLVVAAGIDPAATPVREVATETVVSVTPDTHIKKCVALLEKMGVRHLPVVEGSTPVGILSARDLFASVAQGLGSYIDQLQYEKQLADGVDPYDHIGGSYEP